MPKRKLSQTIRLSSSVTPPNKTLKRRKSNRLSKLVKTIVTYNLFERKLPKKTQICDFVENEMKIIPQIINLPTPKPTAKKERHAIFVNVISENSVMISDWGGNENRNIKRPQWKHYHDFIKCLEKKYKNVEYYDVDQTLYDIANEKHTKCNHGGCSQYLDLWLNAIYTEGNGYNTRTVNYP
jgi:hypothetical protein